MLNSIEPILIFQIYKKLTAAQLEKIPVAKRTDPKATFAIIPIYLADSVTGLYIDTESKNIDIDTSIETLQSGDPAIVTQKALGSTTTVNIIAKQGSVGLTMLLAISELILDRVTSGEYEVTYMHGGITVFGGLIHGLSIDQEANDDRYKIKIEFSSGRKTTKAGEVPRDPNSQRLANAGTLPDTTLPTSAASSTGPAGQGGGLSVIQPRMH